MDNDYKLMLTLLKGTVDDRRTVYGWLIERIVNGETLNYGYRVALKHLYAEFAEMKQ